MRTRTIGAGLVATLVLAVAIAGTADARRLEVSEQRFLAQFGGLTMSAGSLNVVCAVSLEGSFHSKTISKVHNELIGFITEVHFKHPCLTAEAWALTAAEGRTETLPWHILYETFRGTLPNITGVEVTVDNLAVLVESVGVSCLYLATTTAPAKGILELVNGRVALLGMNGNAPIRRVTGGSLLCPEEGTLHGSASFGRQGDYREIFIRLVQ